MISHQPILGHTIVVMFLRESPAYDPFTPNSIHLATEGTGRASVYRDGRVVSAKWRKPSVEAPLQWVDDSGEPIAVNQGAVWVEVVPIGTQVSAITKPRVSLDKGPTYPSG